MTEPMCAADAFLRSAGPVRVPFQPCCAAVLLRAAQAPAVPLSCPRVLRAAAAREALLLLSSVDVARRSEVIP
jgi:hypothetical protein